MSALPRRGELWWCELPDVSRRPVVVLSRDAAIPRTRRTLIAPCTTTIRNLPTEVILDPSVRTLSYVTTVLQLQNPSTGAIPTLMTLDQSLLVIWPQVVALIALTVIAFAGAYIAFMRQEVRA